MMIYLDNAATTQPAPEVVEVVHHAMTQGFGNPSSRHRLGIEARDLMETSRETVARFCGVPTEQVIFTSGGTEANNLAARGLPLRSGTTRILTTTAEHPSLQLPLANRPGATVQEVPIREDGRIDLEALGDAMGPDVGLVALFEGHNEIGSRNPVDEIAALMRERAPRALLHTDSVQSVGKPGAPRFEAGVHSASISGHKIHGPKGVGALVLNTRAVLDPILVGGGQERARRSGTENVPGIAGLAAAVSLIQHLEATVWPAVARRRQGLADGLRETIPELRVLGGDSPGLPHILSVVIPGTLAEVVLHHLEAEDIFASTGAACTAASGKVSPALRAMGLTPDDVRSTLRLSLSRHTTDVEVETVLDCLPRLVQQVRSLGAAR